MGSFWWEPRVPFPPLKTERGSGPSAAPPVSRAGGGAPPGPADQPGAGPGEAQTLGPPRRRQSSRITEVSPGQPRATGSPGHWGQPGCLPLRASSGDSPGLQRPPSPVCRHRGQPGPRGSQGDRGSQEKMPPDPSKGGQWEMRSVGKPDPKAPPHGLDQVLCAFWGFSLPLCSET